MLPVVIASARSKVAMAALAIIIFCGTALAQSSPYCHFIGPVFPPVERPSSVASVQTALSQLNAFLGSFIEDGTYDALDSVVHVSVFDKRERLLDFAYAPPDMKKYLTAGRVDENTLFRVGSVSKTISVYSLLVEVGFQHMHDPVTKWVPELADQGDRDCSHGGIEWEDITVAALASHMAGLPRGLGLADLVQTFELQGANDSVIESIGLPVLSEGEKPSCGAFHVGLEPCGREEFFRVLNSLPPVTSPFQTPIYSNVAFHVLGYVVEGITGVPWAESLKRSVLEPLGMSRTFPDAPVPDSDNAVIPVDPIESWFNVPLGGEAPGGGIFSTAADLAKLGQAILTSAQISPATTRAWFKPVAHTYGLKMSEGLGWTIRSMLLPLAPGSNHTRRADIYSKDGGVGAYSALLVFSPDHEFGFSVLVSSANPASGMLLGELPEMVIQALAPAFEEAGRAEAARRFAGRYANANGTMELEVDDEFPGIRVASWTKGDINLLESFANLRYGPGQRARVTLYPMQVESRGRIAFRGVFERVGGGAGDPALEESVFMSGCPAWAAADAIKYGNVGLDDFEFISDEDGEIVGVSPRVLRETLAKV